MADAVTERPRAFVATLVAVTPPSLMDDTAAALATLRQRSALRTILIVPGDLRDPEVRTEDDATTIDGLIPRYLNNAVASLRLSSLPAIAWWRGGTREVLDDLASLVDRLVLDSADPLADWRVAAGLHERAAITDLRWARLTRWRSLMAQFFDLPAVRTEASSLTRLEISAADDPMARLFAGWLATRLPNGANLNASIRTSAAGQPMESMTLHGGRQSLRLTLLPSATCVETTIALAEDAVTTRVVPLGDQSTPALLAEELRVRAHDHAFEQAVRYLVSR